MPLSQQTIRRLRLALVALTLLALAGVTAHVGGFFRPRLEWPHQSASWSSGHERGKLSFSVPMENHGWSDVTIVGAGKSLPGLELAPALKGMYPMVLSPGEQVSLPVDYLVTDCAHVASLLPMPVRVKAPWGEQTVHVDYSDHHYSLECQS